MSQQCHTCEKISIFPPGHAERTTVHVMWSNPFMLRQLQCWDKFWAKHLKLRKSKGQWWEWGEDRKTVLNQQDWKKLPWSKEEKIKETPDNKELLQNIGGNNVSFMLMTASTTDMGLKFYEEKFKEDLKDIIHLVKIVKYWNKLQEGREEVI